MKSEKLQVYISKEAKTKLTARAKKEGRSESQMAANILTFALGSSPTKTAQ